MPPLSGIRVADFTRHLPGPFATDMLRRLGADVYKVEPPEGDPIRWIPPASGDSTLFFKALNRGKRSVVVDLKKAEGREFARRLALACDVVVESYRPGVAGQFGIDAQTLRGLKPGLIHCSISGYGAGNPRSGHDLNFTALSGLLDFQRDHEGRPTLPSSQLGDIGGALFAALLIVAAIHQRDRTAAGSTIDLSLASAARAVIPTAEVASAGGAGSALDLVLRGGLPNYEIYETADGGHLSVACLEPRFWDTFCRAIGHPELAGEEFHESAWPEVTRTISDTLRTRTRAEWEAVFEEVDACVEPILTVEEARIRFGALEGAHPLNVFAEGSDNPAPAHGSAFNDAAAVAGYTPEEIETLLASGAFTPKETLGGILSSGKRPAQSR